MTPQRLPSLLLATVAAALVLLSGSHGPDTADAGPQRPAPLEPQRLLDADLTADGVAAGACHTAWRAGDPGIATESVSISGLGEVVARLNASGGDWDLALFGADGRSLAGGATTAADETASSFVLGAQTVRIQACRRSDDAARTATLDVDFTAIDTSRKPEKVQLVSVKTPTKLAKARLM